MLRATRAQAPGGDQGGWITTDKLNTATRSDCFETDQRTLVNFSRVDFVCIAGQSMPGRRHAPTVVILVGDVAPLKCSTSGAVLQFGWHADSQVVSQAA